MSSCECFFCQGRKPHPDERHPNFGPISHRLLVTESLDSKDSVSQEACETCGHVRDASRTGAAR